MPWDAGEHGGFSAGEPWLPAYPDAAERSVAAQLADPRSSLALYRRLLRVRRDAGLGAGRSVEQLASTGSELSFDRAVGARRFRFVARLDEGRYDVPLPGPGRLLVTARDPAPDPQPVTAVSLSGPDAVLVELLPRLLSRGSCATAPDVREIRRR